jgi:hypothetical protein
VVGTAHGAPVYFLLFIFILIYGKRGACTPGEDKRSCLKSVPRANPKGKSHADSGIRDHRREDHLADLARFGVKYTPAVYGRH